MKIRFQDVIQRITGISTLVFGVSWNPPQLDRDVVRSLLAFLEDRRALYYPYTLETAQPVIDSVHEMRRQLSDALGQLEKDSMAGEACTLMRRACREVLDKTEHDLRLRGNLYDREFQEFLVALGKLRGLFGIQIARLSVAYGIDVEDELARILPPSDADHEVDDSSRRPRRRT